MLKVGVTGNIASGKSIVCRVFSLLGISVFDADFTAKQLYEKPEVVNKVINTFGNAVIKDEMSLNKSALAEIVFSDALKLKALSDIIHPLVKLEFKKWCNALPHETQYCIHENAVLLEGGFNEDIDSIILVTAPEEIRFKRAMERGGLSLSNIKTREAMQQSESSKIAAADFIIVNDGNSAVLSQIFSLHSLFINKNKYF